MSAYGDVIVGLVGCPPNFPLLRGLQGALSCPAAHSSTRAQLLVSSEVGSQGPGYHWLRWVGSPVQGYSGGGSAAWSPQQRACCEVGVSPTLVTDSKPI